MAKLSEFLPDVPQVAQTISNLNEQINMLQLMKSAGDTGQAPTIGLDHVVNTWVRHQMAYRQQLVMDLQTITFSVQEIRGPLTHITGEVFRRGMKIVPTVKNPDKAQLTRFSKFLSDANMTGEIDTKSATKPELVEFVKSYMGYKRGGKVRVF